MGLAYAIASVHALAQVYVQAQVRAQAQALADAVALVILHIWLELVLFILQYHIEFHHK